MNLSILLFLSVFDLLHQVVTLSLSFATQILCVTHLLIMVYFSVKFDEICFSRFKLSQRQILTSDLTLALPLNLGTILICATHLFILLYLCEVSTILPMPFISYFCDTI